MKIKEILDKIPNYKEFMTIEELSKSSKKLANEFESVEIFEIGKSKERRIINCLKIGNGNQNALLIAFPHPNEPIGSLTVDFFSRFLAENPNLTKKMGFTWYLIYAIDIDGAILNEGWFKGKFDPIKHARNYYRPSMHEQVEWTFPINYKKLNFATPIPETQALINLINNTKPYFTYSLHNAGFCGVFYYVSKEIKKMCHEFIYLVKEEGLPIHEGEPEYPFIKKHSPGIYQSTGVKDTYDFMESIGIYDPTKLVNVGGSSYDYIKSVLPDDFFFLVCEMPYIYDKDLENKTYTEFNRRDVIIESLNYQEEIFRYITPIFKKIKQYSDKSSRLFSCVSSLIKDFRKLHKIQLLHAKTSPTYEGKATIAEVFDSKVANKFTTLTSYSQLGRLLQEVSTIHPEKNSEFKEYQVDFEQMIEEKLKGLLQLTNYEIIPIQKLVKVQVGSCLIALKHLTKNFPIT